MFCYWVTLLVDYCGESLLGSFEEVTNLRAPDLPTEYLLLTFYEPRTFDSLDMGRCYNLAALPLMATD